eukprot:TRINITY_DN4852_c0_g1_i9.p2 TRINITY_DN4852_c0_g1~~TRINITY_DN4852_c0_g1_i9.p2  ORF type:complete len:479 (-),score=58.35 TRINITY_DN4852_c0_g1_i9:283-1719(-)
MTNYYSITKFVKILIKKFRKILSQNQGHNNSRKINLIILINKINSINQIPKINLKLVIQKIISKQNLIFLNSSQNQNNQLNYQIQDQNNNNSQNQIQLDNYNQFFDDENIQKINQNEEEQQINKKIKYDENINKLQKQAQKQQQKQLEKQQKQFLKHASGNFSLYEIETIIDFQLSLDPLGIKIKEYLQQSIQSSIKQQLKLKIQQNLHLSPFHTITWKRKLLKQQLTNNPSDGSKKIQYYYNYLLTILSANQFFKFTEGNNFEEFMEKIKQNYGGFATGFLVRDLESEIKKQDDKNLRNYIQNQQQLSEVGGSVRDRVGDFVVKVLLKYPGVRFRSIENVTQGAEHVHALTITLARQPYWRNETILHNFKDGKLNEGARKMEDLISQFSDGQKAWAKCLYRIDGVGPKDAVAIAQKYPSMRILMKEYLDDNTTTLAQNKELLLENLVTDTGRRLGPAASRKVYRALCCADENQQTQQ